MKREIIARSSGGLFPHTHTLSIPKDSLENPPASGLTLTTSEEYSLVFKHKHEVFISFGELQSLKHGQTVVVKDTDKGRHQFSFCNT